MTQTQTLNKIDLLDGGYIIMHDDGVMGSDLSVVNSARVSYGKRSEELSEKDIKLIHFLAREGHTSPFRHATLQFEVKVPLMIARQWWKYIVGSGWQDPMVAWNESSRRYITSENEYHMPDYFRATPANSKQGSGAPVDERLNNLYLELLHHHQQRGEQLYQDAMKDGICAEQARLFLSAYGLYVHFYWTASLQGVAHLIAQRTKPDAQKEFQDYANAVEQVTRMKFTHSIDALLKQKD